MRRNRVPKMVVRRWRYDGYIAKSYTCIRPKSGPLMLTIHTPIKAKEDADFKE